MIVVVDASIAAKWFLRERDSPLAERLLQSAHELVAPDFMRLEVANALLRAARRGQIGYDEAEAAVDRLAGPAVRFEHSGQFVDTALNTAARHGGTVYDAVYIVQALSAGAVVLTDDLELARTATKASATAILLSSADFAKLI